MPKTKKPLKYPRKLRMKLEKITGAREQPEPRFDSPRSYWSMFLKPRSVALMTANIDEVLQRIEIMHYLEPQGLAPLAAAPSPWARRTGTSVGG